MSYETFDDVMTDVLSSGNGIKFTNWHKRQLKELFSSIHDKSVLVQYLNDFYSGQEPDQLLEGELDEIAELIGGTYKASVVFAIG